MIYLVGLPVLAGVAHTSWCVLRLGRARYQGWAGK